MARHAFDTFIPLSVDSDARKQIIFDFFDLLSAIAAHSKTNGLGGRKLSRMAGWWAFELMDNGNGFDGGYKSWARYEHVCRPIPVQANHISVLPMLHAISFSPIFDPARLNPSPESVV
jgi:hypothetical protein